MGDGEARSPAAPAQAPLRWAPWTMRLVGTAGDRWRPAAAGLTPKVVLSTPPPPRGWDGTLSDPLFQTFN